MCYDDVMIYLLPHYGFCPGLCHSIEILAQALKENKNVHLLLPLLHNEEEMKRLKDKFHGLSDEDTGVLIFPAHGHTKEEDEKYKNQKTYDAICPFLQFRHQFLLRHKDATWFYVGKKEHQETKSYLSYHPDLKYVSPDESDYVPDVKGKEITGLIVQSTLEEEKKEYFQHLFMEKTRLTYFLGPCPRYVERKKEADEFLKQRNRKELTLFILGSKTSSNCLALFDYFQKSYPSYPIFLINRTEDIPSKERLTNDILFISSTSISEESIMAIKKETECLLLDQR